MENSLNPPALKLLSGDKKLIIEPLDGTGLVTETNNIFKAHYDPAFKKWGLAKPGAPTPATIMDVYQQSVNGKYDQIYASLPVDLKKLTVTQHQINRFCEKYQRWLRPDGYGTNFLIEKNNDYFVVGVNVSKKGAINYVNRYNLDYTWPHYYRMYFVVPRFTVI